MPPVFNRYSPDPHPWDDAINEWLGSGDVARQALARNLMHDYRVSPERERVFDLFGQHPRKAVELEKALTDFQDKRIRVPKQAGSTPDFLDSHNNANFLSGGETGEHKISKDMELARVIDLNNLITVFQFASDNGVYPFVDIARFDGAILASWLKTKLDRGIGASDASRRAFIEAVIEAMNLYRDFDKTYHPTWATSWEAFIAHVSSPAIRWSEVVGVDKRTFPRWLMVLRYTVREAEAVVRPTQLDGGFYAFHFPSPPQSPLTDGGHPMDLQVSPAALDLLPEFIHPQIEHTIAHWDNTGLLPLCERTDSACSNDFTQQRTQHYQRLIAKRGSDVAVWMPNCL